MSKLIHISEAASLAIHSLALIAGSEVPVNATQIANRLGSSRNHIAKVLQHLVKQGYLSSIRGPHGGFLMKAKAGQITLLEVYEMMEGSVDMEYCSVHSPDCPFTECVFGDLREKLNTQFLQFFQNRKISDIIHLK